MRVMDYHRLPFMRSPLGRELTAVILFKLAALFVIWYLFFNPAHRVTVTPASVQQSIFAPADHAAPTHGDANHA